MRDDRPSRGSTVDLYQDPAKQAGAFITIRRGRYTGVARLSDLTNIHPKN